MPRRRKTQPICGSFVSIATTPLKAEIRTQTRRTMLVRRISLQATMPLSHRGRLSRTAPLDARVILGNHSPYHRRENLQNAVQVSTAYNSIWALVCRLEDKGYSCFVDLQSGEDHKNDMKNLMMTNRYEWRQHEHFQHHAPKMPTN